MGEILKFSDFKKNNQKKEPKKSGEFLRDKESLNIKESVKDFSKTENLEEMKDMVLALSFVNAEGSEIIKEINSATRKGIVLQENLIKNLNLVKSYSTEELINWMKKSNKSDWNKKPAFFKAIVTIFLERVLSFKK